MKTTIAILLAATATYSTINAQTNLLELKKQAIKRAIDSKGNSSGFAGAVYAMANGVESNSIAAYGRRSDGTLEFIGNFATGGKGGIFDGGEGLDPLISAYALEITQDRRHLLAVNAGSSTITAFRINRDFSLTKTDQAFTFGVGPNSIALRGSTVFVTNIDADGEFAGEPDQEGSLVSYKLTRKGRLIPLHKNYRTLENRPSAVRISPNGRNLLVSSINAGSAALESQSNDELVMFGLRYGKLTAQPVATATSTEVNNPEGRNLPSAIGFEVVREGGRQFAVVTEAREFQPNGAPPAFPALQTGSVSTWEIIAGRDLEPVNLDVIPENRSIFDGERTACWLTFSNDQSLFWVSNALDASLSTYSFDAGNIEVVEEIAAQGIGPTSSDPAVAFGETQGWIDLDASADGNFLYQLYGLEGTIGVFAVNEDGTLTEIQEVTGELPETNTQGIIAF